MKTLTRAELIDVLITKLNFEKHDAAKLVELFFEQIVLALSQGEPVHLSGLGNFNLIDKGPRPGRNPKTGEPCTIAPRRVVSFRPGKKLKAEIAALQ